MAQGCPEQIMFTPNNNHGDPPVWLHYITLHPQEKLNYVEMTFIRLHDIHKILHFCVKVIPTEMFFLHFNPTKMYYLKPKVKYFINKPGKDDITLDLALDLCFLDPMLAASGQRQFLYQPQHQLNSVKPF